jgi:hypothetical protein
MGTRLLNSKIWYRASTEHPRIHGAAEGAPEGYCPARDSQLESTPSRRLGRRTNSP